MTVNTTRAGAFTGDFGLYTCRCWKRTKSDSFFKRYPVDKRFLLVRVSSRTCNKELPAPTVGRLGADKSVRETLLSKLLAGCPWAGLETRGALRFRFEHF